MRPDAPGAVPPLKAATSRGEASVALRGAFAAVGIAEAALDARLLLLEAAGIAPAELALRPEHPLGAEAAARLAAMAARRLAGEPVGRILGRRGFWGVDFALGPDVLEPRPDSETLVAALIAEVAEREAPLALADLGTGSGCLLVALLLELPRAVGIGIDRAPGALAVARRNAAAAGVGGRTRFLAGNWLDPSRARFDLIVSNPPYIPTAELAGLAPEVRDHDPRAALDGGADGLDAYRRILAAAPAALVPEGLIALEFGIGQAPAIQALGEAQGLRPVGLADDLGGHPRALVFRRG